MVSPIQTLLSIPRVRVRMKATMNSDSDDEDEEGSDEESCSGDLEEIQPRTSRPDTPWK